MQFSTNSAERGLLLSLFFGSRQAMEMQLCNTNVFQALNSPSTHRMKHRALILFQNIAVTKTSVYHTVFYMQ